MRLRFPHPLTLLVGFIALAAMLIGFARAAYVVAEEGLIIDNFLTPTNGGLMAILAAAGVPYGKWIRFLAPIYAGLFLLGFLAVGIAIFIRLS